MAAKPQPYQGFGNMLTEALKQLAIQRTMKAVQSDLAEELGYAPRTIYAWRNGEHLPPPEAIERMARIFVEKEAADQKWINDFLKKGEYGPTEAVAALNQELFGQINDRDLGVGSHNEVSERVHLQNNFFVTTLINWSSDFFRWSGASAHLRSSWTGRVMHILTVTIGRITSGGFLAASLGGLLILVNALLLMPVLQWPLEDTTVRWWAYLKYSLATLLIPLWVAWVTPPDRPGLFQLETVKERYIFWLLKFTGALVGFWVFSVLTVFLTLILYYFHLAPLPGLIRAILATIPLFFSYVVARRIPLDRHKMFDGVLKFHPADRLFLGVFTVGGPFVAWFLYFSYGFLSDRSIAPLALLILLNVITLWEYRKRHRRSIPDPVLILILGFLVPSLILLYAYFTAPDPWSPELDELALIIIASFYVLSMTGLIATLLVRNPPTLTLRGVFSLFALTVLATLAASVNLWLGTGFVLIISLIWILWGRKRLKSYFRVHPGFWLMVAVIVTAGYLLTGDTIPLWANELGFIITSGAILAWAYRIPPQPTKKERC